ncbi:hypothetical protein CC53_gp139 [Rhizobium phage vB_RleS_L338C]|uniref:hypothetical protein n=1 Tax=Rhizobium phage vB_RleS_L338C TaxID=1414737 RepID=UPI0003D92CAF|nr:hypothetical protein CC53_gp139 [Rhizobium phage vB_RleS_L338C]AHC30556.1 hypothetical protein L338C_139 [Rhizobium phage vB_RleS_L338C]QNH72133.1 hypothetical protein P11VFA_010 [Rhizobium phage P11VFA]
MNRRVRLADRAPKSFKERMIQAAKEGEELRRAKVVKKLWRLSQRDRSEYDTYDRAVVVAVNEDMARRIHPNNPAAADYDWSKDDTWARSPEHVTVKYLGICEDDSYDLGDVVCESFNAG